MTNLFRMLAIWLVSLIFLPGCKTTDIVKVPIPNKVCTTSRNQVLIHPLKTRDPSTIGKTPMETPIPELPGPPLDEESSLEPDDYRNYRQNANAPAPKDQRQANYMSKEHETKPPFLASDISPIHHLTKAKKTAKGEGPNLPPASKSEEPVVLAMKDFIYDRPNGALDHLKKYDPANQEILIRLLPLIAQMTKRKLEDLSPEEVRTLQEQLDNLLLVLRSRADLVIDRMCFCESINGYGDFKALPEDHIFRAGNSQMPGEPVQVYVQLRNLGCKKRQDKHKGCYFETRLSSSVEILDKKRNRVWYYDFQDRNHPLVCCSARNNYFNNYTFAVPRSLPPGDYTLAIQVRDLSTAEDGRVARKELPFRVGN